MKNTKAIIGILVTLIALGGTLWKVSAGWTKLEDKLNLKAEKSDVEVIKTDIKLILCALDDSKCIITPRRKE